MARPDKTFSGVETHQEINIAGRRDDVRTIWQKLGARLDTPGGVMTVFGTVAVLVALPLCIVPGAGEIGVLLALLTYMGKFSYGRKKWQAPFRVPAWVSVRGKKFVDSSTGKVGQGLIYLGREFNTLRQVWASANDIKTHQLVLGTTGSGKTEEILGGIFNALVLDSGAMLVDGKSDPKTFNSLLAVCRALGREEDILLLNYIMGGKDFADGMDSRRSHTYNPLGSGSAAMKAELMVSLLDSGSGSGSDMWQGRAISYLEAIMPPLSYLADRGLVLFNPKLLCDFFLLENIENLIWFGLLKDLNGNIVDLKNGNEEQQRIFKTLIDKYCGNIKLYVENLPGYSAAKPKKPHQFSDMSKESWSDVLRKGRYFEPAEGTNDQGNAKAKQQAEQTRGKVLEQHGFITMQLVRATGNLTFNYGHIYNDEIGEISYRDALLNRRVMLVMLPALERSKQSMEQLGKMAVSAIKGVLATLLDTPLEGKRREIIDGRPSNAEIPYSITCDEYGYYVVPGFAVAPAQARSYGVSITFGAQDFPSLTKGNREEGEATWENTNLRFCGRMTGGEESETYKKISGAGGKAPVSTANSMEFNRGASMDRFTMGTGSQLEMVNRIHSDDLNQQENGEFHLIVGRKSEMSGMTSRGGGARVVRMLSFYTGNVPQTEELRLVHYVQVKMFSDRERDGVLKNEAVAQALRGNTTPEVSDRMCVAAGLVSDSAQQDGRLALADDVLGKFIHKASMEGWMIDTAEMEKIIDDMERDAVQRRKAAEERERDSKGRARVMERLRELASCYDDERNRVAHESLLEEVVALWGHVREDAPSRKAVIETMGQEAQKKVAKARMLL